MSMSEKQNLQYKCIYTLKERLCQRKDSNSQRTSGAGATHRMAVSYSQAPPVLNMADIVVSRHTGTVTGSTRVRYPKVQ